jgi:Transglycosylase
MARPDLRRGAIATAALLLLLGILALPSLLEGLVASRLHALARARGLEAHWSELGLHFPGVTLEGLRVVRAGGDTLVAVDTLDVSLRWSSLFLLRVVPRHVRVAGATIHAGGAGEANADTLDAELPPDLQPAVSDAMRPADPGVRDAADALIRLLLVPARQLPELDLREVSLTSGASDERSPRGIRIETLSLRHYSAGARGARSTLEAEGIATLQRGVPFTFDMTYDQHDHVTGHARFDVPDPLRGTLEPLSIGLDGMVVQSPRAGEFGIRSATLTFGTIPVRVSGLLARRGPHFHLDFAADSLTATRWRLSVPRSVLGPLLELTVRGSWDQRLSFDLDLAEPDSVRFDADVIPHGLALESSGALDLTSLEGPFVARIHLPGTIVERDLSPANPRFRPLDEIDSTLVHAVVTNEDGGFYHHGGFNMDAVRASIAENARAGRFRRGAGTITMQLVRNLFLGHERTLSRKWQEVVMAWTLEHLTRLSKARLLEIYLNIIEWGPGVHGADEATRFYFGHDAGHVTPAEALFLATVVPSPSKWRWRFDRDGTLRPGTLAQMHFIGRRMIDKGWLDPADLPPRDSLQVELRGSARDLFEPTGVEDPRFETPAPEDSVSDSAATMPADTVRSIGADADSSRNP